ncbi:unnamed protein product [Vicia faba]|uniref:Uncharacterized protein n=1 Tax=Vicia faba TaxID=3906 RepID=A0AAV1AWK0_VICFA|nr:unnamed protein product [Vicia faba]
MIHATTSNKPTTQVYICCDEAIRRYYGIDPEAVEALLNDKDILDIGPFSVYTSLAKPPVTAKQPATINPISFDTITTTHIPDTIKPMPTVRIFIGAKPKVSKYTIKPMPTDTVKPMPTDTVKPMATDTKKEKGQTSTYKLSMSDHASY